MALELVFWGFCILQNWHFLSLFDLLLTKKSPYFQHLFPQLFFPLWITSQFIFNGLHRVSRRIFSIPFLFPACFLPALVISLIGRGFSIPFSSFNIIKSEAVQNSLSNPFYCASVIFNFWAQNKLPFLENQRITVVDCSQYFLNFTGLYQGKSHVIGWSLTLLSDSSLSIFRDSLWH